MNDGRDMDGFLDVAAAMDAAPPEIDRAAPHALALALALLDADHAVSGPALPVTARVASDASAEELLRARREALRA
ncbi:hypothetical protein [Streptomyces sp. NPDC046261]|uniref:hypothetical protein n=1 Tax=Streptomyces sp. NPDC046261 TaxID=3157200 RepID=UPI0033CBE71D